MSIKLSLPILAIVASWGLFTPVFAQTYSSEMSVSAVVHDNCTVTASPMAFAGGSITSTASVESTSRVSVLCTSPAVFSVDMDRGVNAQGEQRRMMSSEGNYLGYQIYSDAALTREWGVSEQGIFQDSQGVMRTELIAYGRINAVELMTPSGGYRDTVTVSINF